MSPRLQRLRAISNVTEAVDCDVTKEDEQIQYLSINVNNKEADHRCEH